MTARSAVPRPAARPRAAGAAHSSATFTSSTVTAGSRRADPAVGRDLSTAADVVPEPSEAARRLFGAHLPLAQRYAALLASEGVRRGLIGPREVPRLWERHLDNCALVGQLLPADAGILDVGSGAGLPGVVLAVCRPDLRVDLLEPMARRTAFLDEVVGELGLADRVRVFRGRTNDAVALGLEPRSWVVARAVAPLERLVTWCLPLLQPGGTLVALKGSTAADEAAAFSSVARRMRVEVAVTKLGNDVSTEPTWVVRVRRDTGRAS